MSVMKEKLKAVRDLFAATHWTTGEFMDDSDEGKTRYCLIGGLRYVFHGDANHQPEDRGYSDTVFELLRTLDPDAAENLSVDSDPLLEAENKLIDFNDDDAELSYVLDLLDRAMARVPA